MYLLSEDVCQWPTVRGADELDHFVYVPLQGVPVQNQLAVLLHLINTRRQAADSPPSTNTCRCSVASSFHLNVLSFLVAVALVVGGQRPGRPPASPRSLVDGRGALGAEGPAERHGSARTPAGAAAGHLRRRGVRLVRLVVAARRQPQLFIILRLIAVLKGGGHRRSGRVFSFTWLLREGKKGPQHDGFPTVLQRGKLR